MRRTPFVFRDTETTNGLSWSDLGLAFDTIPLASSVDRLARGNIDLNCSGERASVIFTRNHKRLAILA